jgi:hypothetical protein
MKPVVLAYRADWSEAALPTERIDYKSLTHIAHSFAIAGSGGLRFPATESSRKLVDMAHRNGVKVLLAVGGADSNKALSALCETGSGTRKLAAEIAARVRTIGYDGADIDWEHPENATDTARLSRFTAALRGTLPRPKMVTIAVPSVDWNGRWYDASAILPHVDWAAVMCYDFYGPWTETRRAPFRAVRPERHRTVPVRQCCDPLLARSETVPGGQTATGNPAIRSRLPSEALGRHGARLRRPAVHRGLPHDKKRRRNGQKRGLCDMAR